MQDAIASWLDELGDVTPQHKALMLQLQRTTALHTSPHFTGVTFAPATFKAVFSLSPSHDDDNVEFLFERYFGTATPRLLERIKFCRVNH
jgi:hypothetical protein